MDLGNTDIVASIWDRILFNKKFAYFLASFSASKMQWGITILG